MAAGPIAELALFPHGSAEGLPSLRITPASTDGVEVEDLIRAAEPYWVGNCWGIWLDGFSWDVRTSLIVDSLQHDPAWSQRQIVATMDVRRPETALQRCTLVADATAALEDATNDADALAIIERLHPYTRVMDLVVRFGFAAGPTVLDRLHAAVGPDAGGTLHVDPSDPWAASLRRSVFQARTPWAMRLRGRTRS